MEAGDRNKDGTNHRSPGGESGDLHEWPENEPAAKRGCRRSDAGHDGAEWQ